MKRALFALVLFLLPVTSYAYEFSVIYTGNSYASLYPCGSCPASVGGGVTRRAAKIKEIKNKIKNILLIDAGNFSAGGSLDQASINPDMDKKRSEFYYKAMEKIGYDALTLGEGEFNFGVDFLKQSIKTHQLRFISANLQLEGALTYYIKEFPGFKVAVIGISPESIHKKSGLKVEDYEAALVSILGKIKNKADFIILASALGDEQSLQVAEKFKEIKVVLVSGNMTGSAPYDKVGDTIILRPSFRAQEVRLANFDVKAHKIVKWEFKKESLPLDTPEDLGISSIIPACFSDASCQKKEGLISVCQNPGASNALCSYQEPSKMEVILITDKNCPFCSTQASTRIIKSIFLGAQFNILDYKEKQALELIKKYKIETLPCFILPAQIKKEKNFSGISGLFTEKDGSFLLKKETAGLFLFLNRKEIPRRIDFFLNPYEQSANNVFKDLITFANEDKIDLRIHLIISKENNIGYPQEELKAALALKQVFPQKFLEYLSSRIKDITRISCTDTLNSLNLDYKKIMGLVKSKEMEKLIKENDKLINELGVTDGNVLLINNNRIFKVFQIKKEDLRKLFK